jgi:hypothetical protein
VLDQVYPVEGLLGHICVLGSHVGGVGGPSNFTCPPAKLLETNNNVKTAARRAKALIIFECPPISCRLTDSQRSSRMVNKVLVLLTIFRIWNKLFPKWEMRRAAEEDMILAQFRAGRNKIFPLREGKATVGHLVKIRACGRDCGRPYGTDAPPKHPVLRPRTFLLS